MTPSNSPDPGTSSLERQDTNDSLGKPTYCGFKAIKEPVVLVVAEENISPFSLVEEALGYEPSPSNLIGTFKNGDKERKIHCNTKLTDQEVSLLAELQRIANEEGKEFYPSLIVLATRYLSRARGDPRKALKLMEETQQWREQYFKDGPIQEDACLMDDLSHGVIYFAGRDRDLRPTIVVRANRVPAAWYKGDCVDKVVRMLIFSMEYMLRYMLVPGKVENNNVIVDLKGLSALNVPTAALKQVYSIMSHHYMGRVYRFYIVNLSPWLSALTTFAKQILTDRQRQKLVFISKTSELSEDFAVHQLETDLGGSRPILTTFYPFQLLPGPFDAGYKGGASKTAVPHVHKSLAPANIIGRLWDPSRSDEANTRLVWNLGAPEILERVGVQVPKDTRQTKNTEVVEVVSEQPAFEEVFDEVRPLQVTEPQDKGGSISIKEDFDDDGRMIISAEDSSRHCDPTPEAKIEAKPSDHVQGFICCDLFGSCRRRPDVS